MEQLFVKHYSSVSNPGLPYLELQDSLMFALTNEIKYNGAPDFDQNEKEIALPG